MSFSPCGTHTFEPSLSASSQRNFDGQSVLVAHAAEQKPVEPAP